MLQAHWIFKIVVPAPSDDGETNRNGENTGEFASSSKAASASTGGSEEEYESAVARKSRRLRKRKSSSSSTPRRYSSGVLTRRSSKALEPRGTARSADAVEIPLIIRRTDAPSDSFNKAESAGPFTLFLSPLQLPNEGSCPVAERNEVSVANQAAMPIAEGFEVTGRQEDDSQQSPQAPNLPLINPIDEDPLKVALKRRPPDEDFQWLWSWMESDKSHLPIGQGEQEYFSLPQSNPPPIRRIDKIKLPCEFSFKVHYTFNVVRSVITGMSTRHPVCTDITEKISYKIPGSESFPCAPALADLEDLRHKYWMENLEYYAAKERMDPVYREICRVTESIEAVASVVYSYQGDDGKTRFYRERIETNDLNNAMLLYYRFIIDADGKFHVFLRVPAVREAVKAGNYVPTIWIKKFLPPALHDEQFNGSYEINDYSWRELIERQELQESTAVDFTDILFNSSPHSDILDYGRLSVPLSKNGPYYNLNTDQLTLEDMGLYYPTKTISCERKCAALFSPCFSEITRCVSEIIKNYPCEKVPIFKRDALTAAKTLVSRATLIVSYSQERFRGWAEAIPKLLPGSEVIIMKDFDQFLKLTWNDVLLCDVMLVADDFFYTWASRLDIDNLAALRISELRHQKREKFGESNVFANDLNRIYFHRIIRDAGQEHQAFFSLSGRMHIAILSNPFNKLTFKWFASLIRLFRIPILPNQLLFKEFVKAYCRRLIE